MGEYGADDGIKSLSSRESTLDASGGGRGGVRAAVSSRLQILASQSKMAARAPIRAPACLGHPVSSRGRIERHGAHKATKDRGRSRGLRREPVRGAACQSEMYQFIWCSGTHRAAWRSTMPETVALAILRFGSRCNRATWINSCCWERSHLGWVAKGLGALARGPNQAAGQRPGVSDLWHSPLCYCWS